VGLLMERVQGKQWRYGKKKGQAPDVFRDSNGGEG
jgi:hypothetical protein